MITASPFVIERLVSPVSGISGIGSVKKIGLKAPVETVGEVSSRTKPNLIEFPIRRLFGLQHIRVAGMVSIAASFESTIGIVPIVERISRASILVSSTILIDGNTRLKPTVKIYSGFRFLADELVLEQPGLENAFFSEVRPEGRLHLTSRIARCRANAVARSWTPICRSRLFMASNESKRNGCQNESGNE